MLFKGEEYDKRNCEREEPVGISMGSLWIEWLCWWLIYAIPQMTHEYFFSATACSRADRDQ